MARQADNGAPANAALDLVLTVDPDYTLVTILRRVVDGHVWPVPWPIQTPEDVAAYANRGGRTVSEEGR